MMYVAYRGTPEGRGRPGHYAVLYTIYSRYSIYSRYLFCPFPVTDLKACINWNITYGIFI